MLMWPGPKPNFVRGRCLEINCLINCLQSLLDDHDAREHTDKAPARMPGGPLPLTLVIVERKQPTRSWP